MIGILLNILLSPAPKATFTKDEVMDYESLITVMSEQNCLNYILSYPKYRFLQYMSMKEQYLFHGSNNLHIETFEPREQTLYNGRLTKAVFASAESLWSTFYAVFDRKKLVGSFRNGCIAYKNKKYHYYSLNESTLQNNPWTEGKLYILPRDRFMKVSKGKAYFDEWICHDFVKPISSISVSKDDFYFFNKVAMHRNSESLFKTWMLYKIRILTLKLTKTSKLI